MGFAFLIPIAKVALRAVLGGVLNAESLFGAGKGDEKKESAVEAASALLSGNFDLEQVAGAVDEVVALVRSVVEVLNALGLLDDKPGLDVDYNRLIPALQEVFTDVADLADALS